MPPPRANKAPPRTIVFDKEWDTIGALDDLRHDLIGKNLASRHPFDQRRPRRLTVSVPTRAWPVQRSFRVAMTGMLSLCAQQRGSKLTTWANRSNICFRPNVSLLKKWHAMERRFGTRIATGICCTRGRTHMITCTRPECQTASGCKCGRLWDYPVRLSMRTALSEYSDTELWSELYRRGTRPQEGQSVGVTGPGA